MKVTDNLTHNTLQYGVYCTCCKMSGRRWPKPGVNAAEVTKDLGSFLLLLLLLLVYGFHSLSGKTVNESLGMTSGPQVGKRGWTKPRNTSA